MTGTKTWGIILIFSDRFLVCLLTIPRRCFFCASFVDLFCLFFVCHAFMSGHCSLVVTCWERAALLVLLYVMLYCVLSLSHMVSWVRCGA